MFVFFLIPEQRMFTMSFYNFTYNFKRMRDCPKVDSWTPIYSMMSQREARVKIRKKFMQLVWFFHVENRGEKTLWASQHWNWSSGINNHQIQLFHFLIVWRLENRIICLWFIKTFKSIFLLSFCKCMVHLLVFYFADWQEMIYLSVNF